VDALLLGGTTYRGFAAYWPGKTDEAGFGDRINQLPKYVVSRSLQSTDWENSHILRDVAKDVAALKKTGGGLRLFDDNRELKSFMLTHSHAVDNGILILEYKPIN
jgi:dihydrofolate reductase